MRYDRLPVDTFQNMQLGAGVLLNNFAPATGEVAEADMIGATTGGVSFTAVPTFIDFGEDIDNCPKGMKEFMQLDTWDITMSGTFVAVKAELAAQLVALADVTGNKITPRNDIKAADFTDVWWVGNYSDKNGDTNGGYVAIHMINALSTGGFSMQTSDRAKGTFAFEFKAHFGIDAQDVVPFEIYVKAGTAEG